MSRSQWEPIAGDTRGTVTAFARGTGTTVFATTPVGVYRSDDAGRTWELSAGESGVAFGEAITVADTNVFVGARDGLHHSPDGGRTWHQVLGGSRLSAVCAAAGIVLAGTATDGVLRSEDMGRHWSGVNAGLLDLEVLTVCLAADRLAFVGTASGLYRSRNGGDSWRIVETGLDEPAVQCVAVGADHFVVAGTETDGLVYSEDGGTTWQQPGDLADRSVTAVGISSSGHIAAATDIGLFVSIDRGETWDLRRGGPAAILALLDVDGVWLAGAERTGVWRLERETWSEASNGLHASLVSALAVGPDDAIWVAGPTEGIRVQRAGMWQQFGPPDSGVLDLTVAADGTVFVATPEGIYVSTGGTWRLAYAGPVRAVAGSKRIVAVAEHILVFDRETWRTLSTPFEAGSVIALSGDAVATREDSQTVLWHADADGARWRRLLLDATPTALGVAQDGSVWVATTTGVSVSHDHGATFTDDGGPRRVIAIAPPYALELGGRLWRRRDSG